MSKESIVNYRANYEVYSRLIHHCNLELKINAKLISRKETKIKEIQRRWYKGKKTDNDSVRFGFLKYEIIYRQQRNHDLKALKKILQKWLQEQQVKLGVDNDKNN